MMKKVLATHNDIVSVTDDGVRINGELIPRSQPIDADSVGRPLPHVRLTNYLLGPSDVLLISDTNSRSFDARYFGLIDRQHIQSVLYPLVTW